MKPIDMRIEIHIYGKNSVFFAVYKKRYHVVYIKDGIAVGQEFFGSKEELKIKFAVQNIKIQNGKYCRGWVKHDNCWATLACLVLDI